VGSDDFVGVDLERVTVPKCRVPGGAEGHGEAGAQCSDAGSDPLDDRSLVLLELLGSVVVEILTEEHPGCHPQGQTAHGLFKVDGCSEGERANLLLNQRVEVALAPGQVGFAKMRDKLGLQVSPGGVALGEEVLADPKADWYDQRRRSAPRLVVMNQHLAGSLRVGDHPCSEWPQA
jgi:hypothetical protein